MSKRLTSRNAPKVSLVILTYNAGPLFNDLMKGVSSQHLKPKEVIVIDSSSIDDTRKIAKAYGAKVITIPQAEFGHGKTRNKGAALAKGDIIVFLTHDAVPRNKDWLEKLVKPFKSDSKIAGAFSRQIARDDAVPMETYFYKSVYPSKRNVITEKAYPATGILFSNASSAIRKSVLVSDPFAEDILMSEDQEWATRILHKGHKIYYAQDSKVTHSHNTKPVQLFKRYFDFGVSHSEINKNGYTSASYKSGFRHVSGEVVYLFNNKQYRWIPKSLGYNGAKFFGLLIGRHQRLVPKTLKRKFTSSYKGYWQ